MSGWRGRIAAAALMAVAGFMVAQARGPADVVKVRFGGDQIETRVVLELTRSAQAKLVADGAEDLRMVLNFDNVDPGQGHDGAGRGLVKAYSLDRSGGAARLRLDLTRDVTVKRRFLLPPGDGVEVYRYVIDLEVEGAVRPQPRVVQAPAVERRAAAERTPLPRKRVIVIDAGHGGRDPGASGASIKEKAVTLAAAQALKARLEKDGRYKVVMTRDKDVYVPLETRVQIARQANADLFISLHADAGHDAHTRGATVYTLSEKGVDRAARSVFEGGSFIEVDLPSNDRAVRQILLDLTQRATKNKSGAFAEVLLAKIADETTLLRRSHRDAGFVVLLAPDVPAVLLEMGFITNAADEAALSDPARRGRLMNAVADAIQDYFADEIRLAAR